MFKSRLKMQYLEGTLKYKLLSRLVYESFEGEKYTVPRDYVSDGHSIPRLLRSVAGSPFSTKYPKSAWLHDHLLEFNLLSRKEADELYAEAMRSEGASWFQQKRNYWGVRIGSLFSRRKRGDTDA